MSMEHSSKRLLVTGGAGFIGSNLIRHLHHERPNWELVNYDSLSRTGGLANLADLADSPRIRFVHADIRDRQSLCQALMGCQMVVHCARESGVDRSIDHSGPLVATNLQGTQVLLDACREIGGIERLVHVGTDQVYGPRSLDRLIMRFTEDSTLRPRTPHAASMAASDLLVLAHHHTFNTPAIVTRPSSTYGPFQHLDASVPLFITNLIDGHPIPVNAEGRTVRDWLHVKDLCEALLTILERGQLGEVYNIGSGIERSHLELAQAILDLMDADEEMIEWIRGRRGLVCHYVSDSSKIRRELGWSPRQSRWPDALDRTIAWYLASESWWRPLRAPHDRVPGAMTPFKGIYSVSQ